MTEQVKDLRGAQTDNILQRKQSLLDAIDSIRSGAVDEAKTQRAEIQTRIDTILDIDIPANRSARQTAQEQITALRQGEDVPKGIVKFLVDVYDETGETVALATILTMVQKRSD